MTRTISRPAARLMSMAAVITLLATPAPAQSRGEVLPGPRLLVELAGPRVGMTWLQPGVRSRLADRGIEVPAVISQFGWQFERHLVGRGEAVSTVSEIVVLVGGLDQGVVLPSLTWIVGLRTSGGAEFGVGPNITPAGAALALAAGVVMRTPTLQLPVTVAVVPSASGARVSLLTGFTSR